MFKRCASSIILILSLVTAQSCASSLDPSKSASTIAHYHDLAAKHRKTICPAGTEQEFERLLKRYRGLGHWVPEVNNDVDFVTIEKLLPEMERKLQWIQIKKNALAKKKSIPKAEVLTKKTNQLIGQLLQFKHTWETEQDEKNRKKAGASGAAALKSLRQEFARMLGKVSYLTSYAFPVDHLKNRKIHDEFKGRSDATSQQISNYTFFYRRLLEDGAYNPDHTGSDSWLRTTLDTVHLELERPGAILDEDLRYDLDYVLTRLSKELERGKDSLVARLGEWEERTSRALQFYRDLVDPANRDKARALIKEKNQATLQIKEWVYDHQARSWLWWHGMDSTYKALYTLDTILYNEVGNVDNDEALERMDVAQVVYNRHEVPHYKTLDPEQDLYRILRTSLSAKEIQEEAWLNVLYRLGEFSFTYYYMPGAVKAFCPDLSSTGKRLQKENLEIAVALLRQPRKDFPALRYFSRASMPGRINMASVWEDYVKYPERAGLIVDGQDGLRKRMQKGELTYLYRFLDPQGQEYQVYQADNKTYGARLHEGVWLFSSWRNPHYFTYFTLR